MAELHEQDPLGRFSGLEDGYDRYRPGYPAEAVEFIVKTANLGPTSLLIDVGCGTGISSRLFNSRGIPVVGIEPNAAMRSRAESIPSPGNGPSPVYREGRAEVTGLPDHTASAVLAGQSFHWFKPSAALEEFQRILRPDGWVFLMWYERDESDACTAAYGDVIRTAPNATQMERGRLEAGKVLASCSLFERADMRAFPHRQLLDLEGLFGRAFSISYAPRQSEMVQWWTQALAQIFEQYQQEGRVTLHYQTSVYLARRSR